jgi:hypothetical protein
MLRTNFIWLVLVLALLSACTKTQSVSGGSAATTEEPATKEAIGETGINKITLTEQALTRLALETTEVKNAANGQLEVPYGAIIYDLNGNTWTYTNPEANVFVRHPITVDRIEGNSVYLSDGPELGTVVVMVGAAELYGTDTGVK